MSLLPFTARYGVEIVVKIGGLRVCLAALCCCLESIRVDSSSSNVTPIDHGALRSTCGNVFETGILQDVYAWGEWSWLSGLSHGCSNGRSGDSGDSSCNRNRLGNGASISFGHCLRYLGHSVRDRCRERLWHWRDGVRYRDRSCYSDCWGCDRLARKNGGCASDYWGDGLVFCGSRGGLDGAF